MTLVAAFTRRFTRVGSGWTRYARRSVHGSVLAALTLAAVFIAPRSASACTCADSRMPCALDSRGAAIIVGTVLELVPVAPASPTASSHVPQRTYRVQISEVFNGSGKPGDVVTVTTPDGESACGYNFRVGTEYLVYAEPGSGTLTTSLCTRTSPLQAAAEDLALLREIKEGHPVSRLTGTLGLMAMVIGDGQMGREILRPEAGTRITARGANEALYETTLDDTGHFTFRGLPPDTYTLSTGLPEVMKPIYGPPRVSLDACSANADIIVSFIGMWGAVRTPAGVPARGVYVTIAALDDSGRVVGEDLSIHERTDDAGEYEVVGLIPGKYAVGVNVFSFPTPTSPYTPFWVTAPDAPARPRAFEVTDTPPTIVDVQLPAPLETVAITGRVTTPDGSTASTFAELIDLDAPTPTSVVTVVVGDDGRFTMPAIRGRRYRVSANGRARVVGRGSVEVRAERGTPPVEIRLVRD